MIWRLAIYVCNILATLHASQKYLHYFYQNQHIPPQHRHYPCWFNYKINRPNHQPINPPTRLTQKFQSPNNQSAYLDTFDNSDTILSPYTHHNNKPTRTVAHLTRPFELMPSTSRGSLSTRGSFFPFILRVRNSTVSGDNKNENDDDNKSTPRQEGTSSVVNKRLRGRCRGRLRIFRW